MERSLIIAEPWIEKILSGEKTWEMRSRRTSIRGKIGLIRKGSGLIVGECQIVECYDNFSIQQLTEHEREHCITDVSLLMRWPVAWVLKNVCRWEQPIPYKHPRGAVTWVKKEAIIYDLRAESLRRRHAHFANIKAGNYAKFDDPDFGTGITTEHHVIRNQEKEIYIPKHLAKIILDMEEVCFGEGQGGDITELLIWILRAYPELKEDCRSEIRGL